MAEFIRVLGYSKFNRSANDCEELLADYLPVAGGGDAADFVASLPHLDAA